MEWNDKQRRALLDIVIATYPAAVAGEWSGGVCYLHNAEGKVITSITLDELRMVERLGQAYIDAHDPKRGMN